MSQNKQSYHLKVFLKTGSFQCGAVDIKQLYKKHVLHEYGKLYRSFTKRILICNSLQVVEVKICSHVSHGKALPLTLEIAEEFWPCTNVLTVFRPSCATRIMSLCYRNHEVRDERVLISF